MEFRFDVHFHYMVKAMKPWRKEVASINIIFSVSAFTHSLVCPASNLTLSWFSSGHKDFAGCLPGLGLRWCGRAWQHVWVLCSRKSRSRRGSHKSPQPGGDVFWWLGEGEQGKARGCFQVRGARPRWPINRPGQRNYRSGMLMVETEELSVWCFHYFSFGFAHYWNVDGGKQQHTILCFYYLSFGFAQLVWAF